MIKAALGLETQVAQAACLLRQMGIVGQKHTALAGGNQLVGVKAEAAQSPETATGFPISLHSPGVSTSQRSITLRSPSYEDIGAMRFSGILDDAQPILIRQAEQGIHIHRVTIDVHRHNGPRAGCDLCLDLIHVHAPGLWIAVDQDRHTPAVDHRLRAGDNGKAGQNNFIPRL